MALRIRVWVFALALAIASVVFFYFLLPGDWYLILVFVLLVQAIVGWPIMLFLYPRQARKAKRKDYFGEK